MTSVYLRILLALIFLSSFLQKSDGHNEVWCIADEQIPEDVVQTALDWACGNGADCSKIQVNQPCFFPNTVRDHASFAFNNYYQNFKHTGGDCYFSAASIITNFDPSHDSCKFEYLP
ncbi:PLASMODESMATA CALLOSE-BINDING PROTEIN 1-like [Cornus florida]|uniref:PLASMODESMATA CALLOSE-BINDING PROTEIN 1-like n=1 Tax=Cornus florida TaxID=4283 RepID=UPI00289EB18F|nr:PLASMODESMATA CALLOSE-BINDING PROTEIN 1-like [Cornus florida]